MGHVHRSSIVVPSAHKFAQVSQLMGLSKGQLKLMALRALKAFNKYDNRSFAQVVSGKNDRGFQHTRTIARISAGGSVHGVWRGTLVVKRCNKVFGKQTYCTHKSIESTEMQRSHNIGGKNAGVVSVTYVSENKTSVTSQNKTPLTFTRSVCLPYCTHQLW